MAKAKSILLVNPYADEREMYAEALRMHGFSVFVSSDPVAALATAQEHPIDAVVTRVVQESDVDGIALTLELKRDERTRAIRVIVITSRVEPHVRRDAMSAGCDSFLVLPCPPQALVDEVLRPTA